MKFSTLAWPLCLLLSVVLAGCEFASAPADDKPKKRVQPAVAVDVVQLRSETISRSLQRPATLAPRLEVRIFNQEEGRLTSLLPYEGDAVAKGEVLARLDDRLLRASLNKAEATLKQAQLDLNRLERLVKREMVSEEAIERARTALVVAEAEVSLLRTRLDYSVIRAPFDGVVSARLVEPGDVAAKFSHLLTLTKPSPLVAEVGVSELWLPHLKVGDRVSLTIDALPGERFSANIDRIHPDVDRNSRQGVVEVVLEPVPAGARPGQFCRVTFRSPPSEALLVPFAALQYDSAGEFVMRVGADGKAHRAAVKTGDGIDDRLQLLQGLQAGDRVVVRGLLGLKDGSVVSIRAGGDDDNDAPASARLSPDLAPK
jgi:membrane fusion protein (multidrug efflux system)